MYFCGHIGKLGLKSIIKEDYTNNESNFRFILTNLYLFKFIICLLDVIKEKQLLLFYSEKTGASCFILLIFFLNNWILFSGGVLIEYTKSTHRVSWNILRISWLSILEIKIVFLLILSVLMFKKIFVLCLI